MKSPGSIRLPIFALSVALGLSACGFRLAGTTSLPPELARIQLQADDLDRNQRADLRQRLAQAGAEVREETFTDAVRLDVSLKAPPDRRVVASSSRKTVKRVTRQLSYSLRGADGKLLAQKTLTQQGDVTVDDDNLLSSGGERETVVEDLERSLFDRLLRQLARI